MKLATFFTVILLSAAALGIGAQQFENESEYYPKSFQIHRIYTLSKGYRIDYVTQNYKIGTFWAPIEWFRGAGSTGEIAYGTGAAYPYVTFFFKEGIVEHFRLYLVESPAHESWGMLSPAEDYADQFPASDAKPEIALF